MKRIPEEVIQNVLTALECFDGLLEDAIVTGDGLTVALARNRIKLNIVLKTELRAALTAPDLSSAISSASQSAVVGKIV